MPLTAAQQAALSAAIDRLQNYYDGDNPYNPQTNPGGFRQGGQVVNFEPALKDTATVMNLASILVADATAAATNSPKALRVDSAQSFSDAEVAQALANLGLPLASFGQCQFAYVSSTQCKLYPLGGGLLSINGNVRQVPSGGVAISNSNGGAALAAGSVYYAYAYMSAPSAMALEWSTTTYALDAKGTPIKSGDPTRTCVGAAITDNTGKFQDIDQVRGVATFFNRRRRSLRIPVNSSAATSSTSMVPYGQAAIFFAWDDSIAWLAASGFHYNNTAGQGGASLLYLDGNQVGDSYSLGISPTNNGYFPVGGGYSGTPGLGQHNLQNYASATGGTLFMRGNYYGEVVS